MVMIDTSVWVEFFNRPQGDHFEAVSVLLDDDRVAMVGVIAAELIRGCRSTDERDEVQAALAGVHRFDLGFDDWLGIGRELFSLRRKGLTVSLSDTAIVYAAREAECLLYTLDTDFDHFAGVSRYP